MTSRGFDFSRLPADLIPCLLEPLQLYRQDLYNVCLVSRELAIAGQKILYSWIRLFGRDLAIAPLLFQTLSDNPHLCLLIRRLEIRVFPLSFVLKERIEMEKLAAKVLRQCINVRHLTWTRKGSLTDRVLDAMLTLGHLESFEINASTALKPGSWSADKLLELVPLRSMSLILPDRVVANLLPELLERQCRPEGRRQSLKHLTILGRESVVVHDKLFASCLPSLISTRLESLALAGCIKLTGGPLLDLVSQMPSLRNLALEATSVGPAFFEQASSYLPRLRSLKLTHPGPRSPLVTQFYTALSSFLSNKRGLTSFTLYHSGTSNSNGPREFPTVPTDLVASLCPSCPSLARFEISGVLMSLETFERFSQLYEMSTSSSSSQTSSTATLTMTDLVVHFGLNFDIDRFALALKRFTNLRTLHVLCQKGDVGPDDLLELVREVNLDSLGQVGFRNRVWLVRRSFSPADELAEEGEAKGEGGDGVGKKMIKSQVRLDRWDSPFWPEALLVVRT